MNWQCIPYKTQMSELAIIICHCNIVKMFLLLSIKGETIFAAREKMTIYGPLVRLKFEEGLERSRVGELVDLNKQSAAGCHEASAHDHPAALL